MREEEMELLDDRPRTEPLGRETFPVNFANTKCYRCRKNLSVGSVGGWLIKPVRRPEDNDPKDDKVHYDCWWDRVWYYEHGMANAEDRNPPSGDQGIDLGTYDRSEQANQSAEAIDPLFFTKAKVEAQTQHEQMVADIYSYKTDTEKIIDLLEKILQRLDRNRP